MIETLHGIQETVNFSDYTSIRLYDNTENESYPFHWHSPIELIMPLHNGYTVTCANIKYQLEEGDLLIIAPGVIHQLDAPPTGERLILQADFSALHGLKELESTISLITPSIVITPSQFPVIHSQIERLILSIQDEYFNESPFSESYIYSKLIEVLVLVGREYTYHSDLFDNKYSKQKEYTEKFLYVCDYINDHFLEDLSLDQIASLAGFSKYHFSRLFKQFTNVTFYRYLNAKRISHAETLLINPQLSITEISLQSGFSSLSCFIRMFKLIKQCTPTEFRNLHVS